MEISIVISSYNTKDITLKCIDSIYKSGLKKGNFELIVIDDASNDGSYESILTLKKNSIFKKNLRVFQNKRNLGYVRTNNRGIRLARGKFVLLLNSDTQVKYRAIDKLIDFAKKTPDSGVVGARLLNKDGSVQASCYHFPTIKRALLEFWFGRKGFFEKYYPSGLIPIQVEALVGAVFLITPKALKEVGYLDEKFVSYYEDLDYCRRVWKSGLKVYYLPESEVIHLHGESFKKLADYKNQWKKLIPGSIAFNGLFKHLLINAIIYTGQKWQKFMSGLKKI